LPTHFSDPEPDVLNRFFSEAGPNEGDPSAIGVTMSQEEEEEEEEDDA
jgi:hypothetical protein